MKIGICGLWHLGCVTAACLAKAGYDVIAYDADEGVTSKLSSGQAPLFEPGLNECIAENLHKNLIFTADVRQLEKAELIWITYDTPVDDQDVADVTSVKQQIISITPYLRDNTLILISSQLPVGTTRQLIQYCHENLPHKKLRFAYSPENLRLGKAIEIFMHPDRIVVGLQDEVDKNTLQTLLQSFSTSILWMTIESAEMTKHAINAFLAVSVVFINELASICEQVGADAREVERGLKSEKRIGPKAYLRPGNAIAGGTLARDVNFLISTGKAKAIDTPLFEAILRSNQAHKTWPARRILQVLDNLKGKVIANLGLTYKSGTDALRRSSAIELCQFFDEQGATVKAFDPGLSALPEELSKFISLQKTLDDALQHADAVLINAEWPEFTTLSAQHLLTKMRRPAVFDAGGFLQKILGNYAQIEYYTVGRPL